MDLSSVPCIFFFEINVQPYQNCTLIQPPPPSTSIHTQIVTGVVEQKVLTLLQSLLSPAQPKKSRKILSHSGRMETTQCWCYPAD
jgi:hypothetical protein